MSYQTSGVWANNEAGLIFKTADRKGTMLMVGGDTGVLRLYQYPCDVESIDYYKRINGVSKMFWIQLKINIFAVILFTRQKAYHV